MYPERTESDFYELQELFKKYEEEGRKIQGAEDRINKFKEEQSKAMYKQKQIKRKIEDVMNGEVGDERIIITKEK